MGAGRVEGEGDLIAGTGGQIAGALQGDGAGGGVKMNQRLVAQPFNQPDAGGQHGVRRIGGGQRDVFGADAGSSCDRDSIALGDKCDVRHVSEVYFWDCSSFAVTARTAGRRASSSAVRAATSVPVLAPAGE